mgnify:FL=1
MATRSPYGYAMQYTPNPKRPMPKPQPAPATKKVGRPDPAQALPQIAGLTVEQLSRMTPVQIQQYQALYGAQGPNYGGVPKVDFNALQRSAWEQAGKQVGDLTAPYQAERETLAKQLGSSQRAATEFTQAFAAIAGGGNANIDDPEAQRYALENWGGSYIGGMAASIGAQLLGQVTATFGAQEAKYAAEILRIMDTRPDLAERIYSEVAKDASERVKEGVSIAQMDYKNQIAALATYAKALGGGVGSSYLQTAKVDGNLYQYNPATKQWEVGIAGTSGSGGASRDTRLRTVGGSVYEQDPVTGKWSVAIPGKGSGGAGRESASTVSNTVKRATTAGEAALEKVKANIFGKIPGAYAAKDSPEYASAEEAYQAWLDSGTSFGSAMKRVTAAISRHLKAIGYTPAQVKRAAYEIVSAEFDPPKGYKPPKATNVSYSMTYSGGGGEGLVKLLQEAGFSGEGLRIAYGIALRESGGRPEAFNGNTGTGDRSWGLFQINTLGSLKSRVKQFGLKSERDLLDALTNAKVAYRMSKGGTDFGAWGIGPNAYRSGAGMDTIQRWYDAFPGTV